MRGSSVADLAERHNRTRSTIYRILAEGRAKRLLARKIEFIYSDEFALPGADDWILSAGDDQQRQRLAGAAKVPRDVPAWLESLYRTPLLSRGQEWDLFRCYNYLKYKAARLRDEIDRSRVQARKLDEVAKLLRKADAIKEEIVRSNLRLVVSIAKRHMGGEVAISELISDGNMSLMRAVEKFDYTRGAKFGTYASWALMKNYARTIPEEQYRRGRFQTGRDELLAVVEDRLEHEDVEAEANSAAATVQRLLGALTARERLIVTRHYGLNEEGRKQTLEQIGKLLGITKERVRQLEHRALGKLRTAAEGGGLAGIEGAG
jgi:RNA polymerase sigma factor (sigma-70 family)